MQRELSLFIPYLSKLYVIYEHNKEWLLFLTTSSYMVDELRFSLFFIKTCAYSPEHIGRCVTKSHLDIGTNLPDNQICREHYSISVEYSC